jgi:flagellar biosynthesis component FlhA
LVSSILERFDASFLTRVVRDLLADGIPLDRFSQFLEAMASLQATCEVREDQIILSPAAVGTMFGSGKGVPMEDLTAEDYADFIRWELKRFLSHKYAKGSNTLIVYLMERGFEDRLASPAPLQPGERQRLLKAVRTEVGSLPVTSQSPVILTTAGVRRALARELRLEFPRLAVRSHAALAFAHDVLGGDDAYFQLMEQAIAEREPLARTLRFMPHFQKKARRLRINQ